MVKRLQLHQEKRFESAKKETPSVAFTNTYVTGDVEFDFATDPAEKDLLRTDMEGF